MKQTAFVFLAAAMMPLLGFSEERQPGTSSTNFVFNPPESKTGVSTTPSLFPSKPRPPLPPEAQRHEYGGFRMGMPKDEAIALVKKSGKSLEEIEKGTKYRMIGSLIKVPRIEKVKSILEFHDEKLTLLLLFWEDNSSRMYDNLLQMVTDRYGEPEKAQEVFRRYWILENGDCIRLLYDVGAHQASLLYGRKKDVLDLDENEKHDIERKYNGFP